MLDVSLQAYSGLSFITWIQTKHHNDIFEGFTLFSVKYPSMINTVQNGFRSCLNNPELEASLFRL